MDISKFKDFIQKLSIFKDYSSLLVPVVIAMVAVLFFIPTQLTSSKLRKRILSESVSMGKKVGSLSKNAVSGDQWKVEQEYQQAYESDANQTALLARQSTQRQLLSYKIFPEPSETSTLIFKEFGQRYRDSTDGLIARMNARDCPTYVELERNLPSSGQAVRSFGRRGYSGGGKEVDDTIKDVLCRAKAESASVYANPADLGGYDYWGKYEYIGMNEAVKDCWYWQLGYWIIEDVVGTVAAVNSGSSSVFTSPVKRLIGVGFSVGGLAGGKTGAPSYVLSADRGISRPFTRRACNDSIDVVHFNVVVVVSSEAVLPFMKQLCSAKEHKFNGFSGQGPEQLFKHNQITILESRIEPIDRRAGEHDLYRYGEDAVVRLGLVCEYIFNREGYDQVKHELIKESQKEQQTE